jgi:hypothetical protein
MPVTFTARATRNDTGAARRQWSQIVNGAAHCLRCSADVDDQLRDTFDMLNGLSRVYTTFNSMTGIG